VIINNYIMNKQIIAGIIFLTIWIVVMLIWGGSKIGKPDYSSNYQDYQDGSGTGHPLWK